MKRGAVRRALALALACAAVAACAGGAGPESAAAFALPDLAGTEPRVAEEITAAAERARGAPQTALAWGELGQVLDAHGFLEPAAACYRRAHELDPDAFDWVYHLAAVRDLEGADPTEVVSLLEGAAALRGDYAPLWIRLADALSRLGRHDAARERLERAVALDPDLADGHRALGQERILLGDAAGAVSSLQRAVRLDPADGSARAALARAYRLAGNDAEAARAARRARRLAPRPQLRDPLRAGVAARNVSAVALAGRGLAALDAGHLDEAIALLEQSDRAKPDSASTQYNLGLAHWRSGRPERARGHFERAIEISDDPRAHWRLGALLLERGEPEPGRDELRRAVELAGSDAALIGDVATILARGGRTDEALPLFGRAAELEPEDPRVLNNWGSALFESGRPAEALERFEAALRLDPEYATAAFNAGAALEATGRGAEAVARYRRARELDPDGPAPGRLEQLETAATPGGGPEPGPPDPPPGTTR